MFTLAFWVQFGVNMGHDDLVCYNPSDIPPGGVLLSVYIAYAVLGLHIKECPIAFFARSHTLNI